jgi:putative ABC transport system permease protein
VIALLRWVSLRHLGDERARALLTAAGVALGVAAFVSVRLASQSARGSFSDTVDAVAGRANLQVAGTSEGFDERLFTMVRRVPGVAAAAPVVQVAAPGRVARAGEPPVAPASRRWDESLLVLGVDVFQEGPFARAGRADDLRRTAFQLLAEPRAAAVTRSFAARHRLSRGDTVEVLSGGLPEPLVVRRIVASDTLEQAFGGSIVVVDIATAQELFHREGRLDRIDLLVPPPALEAVRERLAPLLPADVEVETPAGRTRQVENLVRAFDLNLTALSFIALYVATFLIFNAVSLSVVRRRREIGILRALGVTRGGILRLFLAEGLVLGALGGAAGVVLGALFARGTLGTVSRTLTDLYLVAHAERLVIDPATVLWGLLLGVGSALVSAAAPALEASRTPPATTVQEGTFLEARPLPVGRWAAAGIAALALAGLVAWWTVAEHRPWGGFASAFLALAGFSLLAPAITFAVASASAPVLGRLLGAPGLLGARALRDALARTSVAVAALAVSVGMMVALDLMVGSFRRTVDTWVRQTLRGDLYVEPLGHRLNGSATVLPPELVDRVREIPGVEAVDTFRGARIRYRGAAAQVIGVEFAVQRDHGSLRFLDGDPRAILDRALRRGEALVTESFAHHQRVGPGDTLALPTPTGVARLRVAGVFQDYRTDAGAVYLDARLYAWRWADRRTESFALHLAPGADRDSVARAVAEAAGPDRRLAITPHRRLRERVLEVFDQTFRITGALRGIAVLVAVLGVVGTLTALTLQRGREIGILRAIGALRGQVRVMVLAESALLGLTGAALGLLAGTVLALLLVHVINRQFFGWTVPLWLPPRPFVQALALVVAAAVLAGLAPARLASGRLAARAMRSE